MSTPDRDVWRPGLGDPWTGTDVYPLRVGMRAGSGAVHARTGSKAKAPAATIDSAGLATGQQAIAQPTSEFTRDWEAQFGPLNQTQARRSQGKGKPGLASVVPPIGTTVPGTGSSYIQQAVVDQPVPAMQAAGQDTSEAEIVLGMPTGTAMEGIPQPRAVMQPQPVQQAEQVVPASVMEPVTTVAGTSVQQARAARMTMSNVLAPSTPDAAVPASMVQQAAVPIEQPVPVATVGPAAATGRGRASRQILATTVAPGPSGLPGPGPASGLVSPTSRPYTSALLAPVEVYYRVIAFLTTIRDAVLVFIGAVSAAFTSAPRDFTSYQVKLLDWLRAAKAKIRDGLHAIAPPSLPWWTWLALPFSLGLIKRKHTETIGRLDVTVVQAQNVVGMRAVGPAGRMRQALGRFRLPWWPRGATEDVTAEGGSSQAVASGHSDLETSLCHSAGGPAANGPGGPNGHGGVSDPFVEVAVGQHIVASAASRIIHGTVNPVFQERFAFRVYSAYATLRVTVWHSGGPLGKQPLGEVLLPAHLFADQKEHDLWCHLRPCGAQAGEKGIRDIVRATDSALGTRLSDATETLIKHGSSATTARAQQLPAAGAGPAGVEVTRGRGADHVGQSEPLGQRVRRGMSLGLFQRRSAAQDQGQRFLQAPRLRPIRRTHSRTWSHDYRSTTAEDTGAVWPAAEVEQDSGWKRFGSAVLAPVKTVGRAIRAPAHAVSQATKSGATWMLGKAASVAAGAPLPSPSPRRRPVRSTSYEAARSRSSSAGVAGSRYDRRPDTGCGASFGLRATDELGQGVSMTAAAAPMAAGSPLPARGHTGPSQAIVGPARVGASQPVWTMDRPVELPAENGGLLAGLDGVGMQGQKARGAGPPADMVDINNNGNGTSAILTPLPDPQELALAHTAAIQIGAMQPADVPELLGVGAPQPALLGTFSQAPARRVTFPTRRLGSGSDNYGRAVHDRRATTLDYGAANTPSVAGPVIPSQPMSQSRGWLAGLPGRGRSMHGRGTRSRVGFTTSPARPRSAGHRHRSSSSHISGGDWEGAASDEDYASPRDYRLDNAHGPAAYTGTTAEGRSPMPPGLSQAVQSPSTRPAAAAIEYGGQPVAFTRRGVLASDTEVIPGGPGDIAPPVVVSDAVVHDYGLGRLRLRVRLQYDPLAEFWSHWLHVESKPPRLRPPFSAPLMIHNMARLYEALVKPLIDGTIGLVDLLTWRDVSSSIKAVVFLVTWSWWPPLGLVTMNLQMIKGMVQEFTRWRLALTARRLRERNAPPLPVLAPIASSAAVILPAGAAAGAAAGAGGAPVDACTTADVAAAAVEAAAVESSQPQSGAVTGIGTAGQAQLMRQATGQATSEAGYTSGLDTAGTMPGGVPALGQTTAADAAPPSLAGSGIPGSPPEGTPHHHGAPLPPPEAAASIVPARGVDQAGQSIQSALAVAVPPSAAAGSVPSLTLAGTSESPIRALGAWRQVQAVWGIIITWLLARVHDTSSSNSSFVPAPRTRAEAREEARRRWFHLDPDHALVGQPGATASLARHEHELHADQATRARRAGANGNGAHAERQVSAPSEAGPRALVVYRGEGVWLTAIGDTISSVSAGVQPRPLEEGEEEQSTEPVDAVEIGPQLGPTAASAGQPSNRTMLALPLLPGPADERSAVGTSLGAGGAVGPMTLAQVLSQARVHVPAMLVPSGRVGRTGPSGVVAGHIRMLTSMLQGRDGQAAGMAHTPISAAATAAQALAKAGSTLMPLRLTLPSNTRLVCLNGNVMVHDVQVAGNREALQAWLRSLGYGRQTADAQGYEAQPFQGGAVSAQATGASTRLPGPQSGVLGPGGQPAGTVGGWAAGSHMAAVDAPDLQIQESPVTPQRAPAAPSAGPATGTSATATDDVAVRHALDSLAPLAGSATAPRKRGFWSRLFRRKQPGYEYGGVVAETRLALRRPPAEEDIDAAGGGATGGGVAGTTDAATQSAYTYGGMGTGARVHISSSERAHAGNVLEGDLRTPGEVDDAVELHVPVALGWRPAGGWPAGWTAQPSGGYTDTLPSRVWATPSGTGPGPGDVPSGDLGQDVTGQASAAAMTTVTGEAADPTAAAGGLAVSSRVQATDDVARVIAELSQQMARLKRRKPRPAALAMDRPAPGTGEGHDAAATTGSAPGPRPGQDRYGSGPTLDQAGDDWASYAQPPAMVSHTTEVEPTALGPRSRTTTTRVQAGVPAADLTATATMTTDDTGSDTAVVTATTRYIYMVASISDRMLPTTAGLSSVLAALQNSVGDAADVCEAVRHLMDWTSVSASRVVLISIAVSTVFTALMPQRLLLLAVALLLLFIRTGPFQFALDVLQGLISYIGGSLSRQYQGAAVQKLWAGAAPWDAGHRSSVMARYDVVADVISEPPGQALYGT